MARHHGRPRPRPEVRGNLPKIAYVPADHLQEAEDQINEQFDRLSVQSSRPIALPALGALLSLLREGHSDQFVLRRRIEEVIAHSVVGPIKRLIDRLNETADERDQLAQQLADALDLQYQFTPEAEKTHIVTIVSDVSRAWQTITQAMGQYTGYLAELDRKYQQREAKLELLLGNRSGLMSANDQRFELTNSLQLAHEEYQRIVRHFAAGVADIDDEYDISPAEALFDAFGKVTDALNAFEAFYESSSRTRNEAITIDERIGQLTQLARQPVTTMQAELYRIEQSLPLPLRATCLKMAELTEEQLIEARGCTADRLYRPVPSIPEPLRLDDHLAKERVRLSKMEVEVYLYCDIDPTPKLKDESELMLLKRAIVALSLIHREKEQGPKAKDMTVGRTTKRIIAALGGAGLITDNSDQKITQLSAAIDLSESFVIKAERPAFGSLPFYRLSVLGRRLATIWQQSAEPPIPPESCEAVLQSLR